MYYTNGKILIHKFNNRADLDNMAAKLTEKLLEEKHIHAEFKPDNTKPFPAYEVPPNVTFHDLADMLRPHLALKAINEDIISLPDKEKVKVRYYFDEKDKNRIAIEMSNKVIEQHKLEEEKAAIAKEFNMKIQLLDSEVLELSQKHSTGYEYRSYDTVVKLNFADRKKYFVDVHEPSVIRDVQDMEAQDFQIRIDHTLEEKFDPEMVIAGEDTPKIDDDEKFNTDNYDIGWNG
jgi:hypothetical protein